MNQTKKNKTERQKLGGGYLLLVALMTGVLLVVNITLVGVVMHVNSFLFLQLFDDVELYFRLTQAAQIVLPVILTMAEFWLFDRIVDRAYGYGRKQQMDDS